MFLSYPVIGFISVFRHLLVTMPVGRSTVSNRTNASPAAFGDLIRLRGSPTDMVELVYFLFTVFFFSFLCFNVFGVMFMATKMIFGLLCLGCIIYGVYLQGEGKEKFYVEKGYTTPEKQLIKRILGYVMIVGGFVAWVVLKHFGLA